MATTSSALEDLAAQMSAPQRKLLGRYLHNALHCEERRSIRAANAKFSQLLTTAEPLVREAGFAATNQDGSQFYVVPPGNAADARLQAVLRALEMYVPSLLALPNDVLHRVLTDLAAEDLSALQRVSKEAALPASAGHLWLRFCPPHFWRAARGAGLE
jgi:hypothetical protein